MMNLRWSHGTRASLPHAVAASGLYQIEEFADPELARTHLQSSFPELVISSCEIATIWHVAGKRLEVVYRISTGQHRPTFVTIRFLRRGTSATHFATVSHGSPNAAAIRHLAAWDAVAWLFPADPGISGLPYMVDVNNFDNRLGVAPSDTPQSPPSWSVLSYLPGRRCALRYSLADSSNAIVGKIGEHAHQRHQTLRSLWDSTQRGFAMPEPLAADDKLGARWERFVVGRRIDDDFDVSMLEGHLPALLEALSRLHQMSVPGLRQRNPDQLLTRVNRKVIPRIAAALPDHVVRAERLAEDLAGRLDLLAHRVPQMIHGDLHTANFLLANSSATFIDLDDLALGDPAFDLALLGSRLILVALDGAQDYQAIAHVVASIPALYERCGGTTIPDDVFAWYMAALLIGRQVKTSIRHLAPRLPTLTDQLLSLAEATLRKGTFDGSLDI